MSTPLLTTKLHIPPARPERVSRPRLIRRLEDGVRSGQRLTLVSAPAGFGKTTLLSDWTEQHGGPVAWLSLDEQDDAPPRFWAYLIAALQTVHPDLGQETAPLLQTAQPVPVQAVLSPLLNEIAALAETPLASRIILVLDDLHLIATAQIHEGLAFLLEHQPHNLHLIMATRADPPLPLFRLRARGQLTELRSDDLRFTSDEAATFLNSVMGLGLAPADVEALDTRTEGWIVGLQLAALALQGSLALQGTRPPHSRSDAAQFIAALSGSHHYVLEYLTEEVVHRQSETVRRFLMQTSVLDRLSGSLCNAVCFGIAETPNLSAGEASSSGTAAMLADLYRRNLFLVPLDDERRWYRYHHLFADLLGNLLRKEQSPAQIRELHLRASAWHEGDGDLDDAIKHAFHAEAYERAAALIEQAAPTMLAHGRLAPLMGWLEALPEEMLRARPRLRLYQGWALNLGGQIDTAAKILQATKKRLLELPPSPENKALRGQLAAALTGIATQREEMSTVLQEGREALAHLPPEDRVSRARVYVALGTAYAYQDDAGRAAQTWRKARKLALEGGNPFLATAAMELLAGTRIYHQGRLREGAQILQRVLDLGTGQDGRRLPFTGTAHALLADVYLEWNDLEAAASSLEMGIELQRQGGIGYGRIHTFCARARLACALGDAQAALQALRTAEQALELHPLWHMVVHLAACQVRLRLWLGEVEAAARWAKGDATALRREMPDRLPDYLDEVLQISRARVHLARQEPDRVLATLEGLEQQARAAGRLAQAIEICLIQALAWQAQGEASAALASLEQALSSAAPEGYVRLFLEAGSEAIPVLRHAVAAGIQPAYSKKLLAAFGVKQEESTATPQLLPEPLTPRELEVLSLICGGLSNQEIAEHLVVTLNTVKKHGSHIYGKLEVKSRTQAIVRAHELELC